MPGTIPVSWPGSPSRDCRNRDRHIVSSKCAKYRHGCGLSSLRLNPKGFRLDCLAIQMSPECGLQSLIPDSAAEEQNLLIGIKGV